MSKSKKNTDLIMLTNHSYEDLMLTDLRRVNVMGISKQKNNKMLAYLNLLVDDILVFREDFFTDVQVSINNSHCCVDLSVSYPYYTDTICLYFDLKKPATNDALAQALTDFDPDYAEWGVKADVELYLDCSIGHDHELMLSNCRPIFIDIGKKVMNNVRLIDQSFFFDNKLISTFYEQNQQSNGSVKINGTAFNFLSFVTEDDTIRIVVKSSFALIIIEHDAIQIEFDDNNKFTFSSSSNFDRDLMMLQYFIKSFISKSKDEEIIDLKNEILLLEMEAI